MIKCLTDLFGPVGQGFGWRVIAEGFERFGDTALHWCRIEFWHTDRGNTFEAYGQTKAAYVTSAGKMRVDEDAPKKSLTDAIVKAASQIGIAANIFLGRWDDQKYVAEVNAEYRKEERAKPADPEALAIACESLANADSVEALNAIWLDLPPAVKADSAALETAKKRKTQLTAKEAA